MAKKEQIKFDQDQLHQMMVEVSSDLAEMLKAEQSGLAKSAEDDEPGESSEGSGGPTEADGSAEGSAAPAGGPPEASASAPPAPEASASPEQSAAAATPDGSPQHEAGEIEPAPTVEGLQQEYLQLGQQDPEALKMHFIACKAAMMAMMGAEQSAPAAPPEASAPMAPPPAAAPAGPPMMGKSEQSHGEQMSKAEKARVEALERRIEEQDKLLKTYDEELGKVVKVMEVSMQPVRKSVKNASDMKFIGRTGETEAPKPDVSGMSRKDIQAKLSEKIREGKLSKSDSEAIYQFNIGRIKVDGIAHLLVDSAK